MNDFKQEISEAPKASGKAITSMVLGILSIPAACVGPLALIPAVPGLILGLMSKNSGSRGFAITGIAASVAGAVLGILVTAVVVILAIPFMFFMPLRHIEQSDHGGGYTEDSLQLEEIEVIELQDD